MAKIFKHPTREAWLKQGVNVMHKQLFTKLGAKMDKKLRVTCGWPSTGATRKKDMRIGECWSHSCSSDGHVEIIVSMAMDEPTRVLDILAHEMCHYYAGLECGHKGQFAKLARGIGLQGKLTATVASPELAKQLKVVAKGLGKYPHGSVTTLEGRKKQTTRMIKCECEDCGYVVRTTRSWLAELGAPLCPCNHKPMQYTVEEEEDDE